MNILLSDQLYSVKLLKDWFYRHYPIYVIAIHRLRVNEGIMQVDHTLIIEIFSAFDKTTIALAILPYMRNTCLPIRLIINKYIKKLDGWSFISVVITYS